VLFLDDIQENKIESIISSMVFFHVSAFSVIANILYCSELSCYCLRAQGPTKNNNDNKLINQQPVKL